MRIVDIRETAIPLRSQLANSGFDFSEMTTSVVAVITDVVREGAPVAGFAFNSTGRYACGAPMRERFIPRLLAGIEDGRARRLMSRIVPRLLGGPAAGSVLARALRGMVEGGRHQEVFGFILAQFKIENGQIFSDAIGVGGSRQRDNIALLYQPAKHHLRDAPPVTCGDVSYCRVAKHTADGHRTVSGHRKPGLACRAR